MSHDKADFDHTMPPQPMPPQPVAKPAKPAKPVDALAGPGSFADKLRQRREDMEAYPAGKPK